MVEWDWIVGIPAKVVARAVAKVAAKVAAKVVAKGLAIVHVQMTVVVLASFHVMVSPIDCSREVFLPTT